MIKILIEGPELAGKSTIATYLAAHLTDGEIQKHIMPENQEELPDIVSIFAKEARVCQGIELVDRFYYPSDIIYSPVYNDGKESYLMDDKEYWDKLMSASNIVVLYIHANEEVVAERYDIREDEYLNKQQCIDSVKKYEEFMKSTNMNVINIDTSKLTKEIMCREALGQVRVWIDDKEKLMGEKQQTEMTKSELRTTGVRMLLESIGEDVNREGLLETPARVARMYDELFCGYDEDPSLHLNKLFTAPSDEIVLIRDIEFWSHCEHHMVPFFGKVHVAYLPKKGGKVVGISKIARVVEGYARRLQIQERLGQQIADAIEDVLEAQGVAVIIEATHLCMKMRGVKNPCADTVTSVVRGAFRNVPSARQELFELINLRK